MHKFETHRQYKIQHICHCCSVEDFEDDKYHNLFDIEHNKFIFLCNNCFKFYIDDLKKFKMSWIKDYKDKYKEFYELSKQETVEVIDFGCVTLEDGRIININTWDVKNEIL